MTKVNIGDDAFKPRGTYLPAGVHEVLITGARRDKTPTKGTEFVEFEVESPDGAGTVTLWMSEKAAPYSIALMGQVAVHNKGTDAAKEKVRESFKAITDTDEIDDKFLEKFIDMQAWVLTEEDTSGKEKPGGGYYLRNNLYSYAPQPRKTTVEDIMPGGQNINADDVPFK
jgi:hypothetical protein